MSARDCKILIFSYHSLSNPWHIIAEEGQLKSWLAPSLPTNIEHIAGYGNPLPAWLMVFDRFWWEARGWRVLGLLVINFDRILSNILFKRHPAIEIEKFLDSDYLSLHVKSPDFYWWQGRKLLAMYRQLIRNDFDYIYIVNTSSYVVIDSLQKYCNSLQGKEIYAGPALETGKITYVSGSSRLISRKYFKAIVDASDKFALWGSEDVQFGKVAASLGVPITNIPSTVLSNLEDVSKMTDCQLKRNFHIRVKAGSLKNRNDVSIMQAIHLRLSN